MSKAIFLHEFISAFASYGEEVNAETWIYKDLSLDADELDWVIRDIESKHDWQFNWEQDLKGYLPMMTFWVEPKYPFADLRIRELFAFSRPTAKHV